MLDRMSWVFAIAGAYGGFKGAFYIQQNFPILAALLGDSPDPLTVGTRLDVSGMLPIGGAVVGFVAGSYLFGKLFDRKK